MQRSGARMLPLFLTLVIVIIVIVAIVSIGRAIFFSGNQTTESNEATDTGRTELLKTTADHSVRLTVRGPIVADEAFKSYQVVVSPGSRSLVVYQGYLDDEERTKQLGNNREAYEEFVYALDKANMMKGTAGDGEEEDDLRGICATGYIYEYAVLVDDEPVKRLWTSTCDGSRGTLEASVEQLNNLFISQVPGANDMIPFRTNTRLLF